MTDDRNLADRARRAAEVAVFAPLGVAAYLRDVAPTMLTMLVVRGRGEATQRKEQLAGAVRGVRNRGEAMIAFGLPTWDTESGPGAPAAPEAERPSGSNGADRRATPEDSALLAIPGYDSLSASQVVERLAGLDAEQLEAVRHYEETHRNRRTILGKIEQLAG